MVRDMPDVESTDYVHTVTVVVPVYRGASTLATLIDEILPYCEETTTSTGATFRVDEILLVDDNGPDRSDDVIRQLSSDYDIVRPVWLSRNYGQHAATLAGMASSASDWIVTMDEDGQHDPTFIPDMIDTALAERASVVYASPTNAPSHGRLRNATSRIAKWIFVRALASDRQPPYHSYRLVLGEIGRSVAAYGGAGIYLDVALGWVTQDFALCPVTLRDEGERTSGYSWRRLLSHFWALVLTSGTRPLRIVSLAGVLFAVAGFVFAFTIMIGRITGRIDVEGWASLSILLLFGFGLVLFSLGLLAEYVGVAARMALGKPPFLVVGDKEKGPLGQTGEQR